MTADIATKWNRLVEQAKQELPGFEVVEKDDSKLMWFLYRALLMKLWCPKFMESFTTAFFGKVYMPKRFIGTTLGWMILRHELVHLRDEKKWPGLFHLTYVLLPVGPSGRAYWEFRAYKESLRAEYEVFGEITDADLDYYSKEFTGSHYLWMWPFPRHIRSLFEQARKDIVNE